MAKAIAHSALVARRILWVVGLLLGFVIQASAQTELHMPDGQLFTRPLKIYVDAIDMASEPVPELLRQGKVWRGKIVAATEKQIYSINGVTKQGTLLVCDFAGAGVEWYRTVSRVTPALEWRSGAGAAPPSRIAAVDDVHVGNPIAAFIWTAVTLILFLVGLLWLIRRLSQANDQSFLYGLTLLCDKNMRLSLARTQVALFTLAIGSLTLGYGLLMPEVPQIPGTLIGLLGLSLATGGLSSLRDPGAGAARDARPHVWQLVSYAEGGVERVSIARAQMLFWTVATLLLFYSRSLADGVLWPVPVEMVGLMGLSQAGYLSTKVGRPTALHYDVTAPLVKGQEMTLTPVVVGGAIQRWSAATLPDGLSLDAATGVISGAPAKVGAGYYKITGEGAGGKIETTLHLKVVASG